MATKNWTGARYAPRNYRGLTTNWGGGSRPNSSGGVTIGNGTTPYRIIIKPADSTDSVHSLSLGGADASAALDHALLADDVLAGMDPQRG